MEFKFPDLGEGITEGEIVKWMVKPGDKVEKDQPILEVETDKAVAEIPCPQAGTIEKLHYKAGDKIKVGDVLFSMKTTGKVVAVEKPKKKEEQGVVGKLSGDAEEFKIPHAGTSIDIQKDQSSGRVQVTPKVRKLAKGLGVKLEEVKGTGPGGRITEQDVKSVGKKVAGGEPSPKMIIKTKYDLFGYFDRIPLIGTRKTIATHMMDAMDSTAHVTHCDKADVTDLVALRKKEKGKAQKEGIHLTYMPYIVMATIAALKKHEILNSKIDGDEIFVKKYFNIGVAVDTERGLLVPVVKKAEDKSLMQIAKEIQELAKKAVEKKLDPMDMKNGTFTITNIGSIGGTFFTPIINYPQAAILGVGKIREEASVINGKVVPRYILYLSVTFDHRILDGAQAARFTNDLIGYLENPKSFLKEKKK